MDLMTPAEFRAMDITVELVNVVCQEVIGRGPTRDADVREFVHHVHCIQQAILSQTAGRAYPDRFRTLGETIAALASPTAREQAAPRSDIRPSDRGADTP